MQRKLFICKYFTLQKIFPDWLKFKINLAKKFDLTKYGVITFLKQQLFDPFWKLKISSAATNILFL